MTAREHLFYGIGIIAFSTARADGAIQAAEKNELRSIIGEWSKRVDPDFDISAIIFKILDDHKPKFNDGFELGMKYIRLGANELDEKLKEKFLYLISDVSHAYPGVTIQEKEVMKRFRSELAKL